MTDQFRNPPSLSSSSPPSPLETPAPPVKCVRGCGFWGSPRTEDMCSRCHKITAEEKAKSDNADPIALLTPIAPPALAPISDCEPQSPLQPAAPASSPLIAPSAAELSEAPPQQLTLAPMQTDTDVAPPTLLPEPSSSNMIAAITQPLPSTTSPPSSSPLPVPFAASSSEKKRKNRCQVCRVKVGLTFFSCRCDDAAQFCSTHRYPHAHSCTFDHKQQKKSLIEKANPIVKNDQFVKI